MQAGSSADSGTLQCQPQAKHSGQYMENSAARSVPLVASVLHPTDFSAASNRAFAHALAIALLRQTELTILHVGPEKGSEVGWTEFPPVRATMERWGLLGAGSPRSAVFDEFRTRVTKVAIPSRLPVFATAKFADQHPADLLVLATEGREGLSRWFKRSDAEAMARWSKTMTLFVPAEAERGLVSLETGDLMLKNILVPVDKAPDCAAAVEFARRTAEALGDDTVNIVLVHVGDDPAPWPPLTEGPGWRWLKEHVRGDPVDEILAAADKHTADLIVMATAGHQGVLDVLRGSTTEQVLRRSGCPLLAVPMR
jgi:nucleotide-binding universal stress UspA family protein